jgi:hypothetical protein
MRIVQKPWGYEEIWAETDRYLGKILHINSGHKLSRQYHEIKCETIRVLSGTLHLELGSEGEVDLVLNVGQVYDIKPGTVHRFCAKDTDVELLEVSTPEINDVVRLSDDYAR